MYRKIHDACVNDHKIIGYVGHGFSLFAIILLFLSLFISALNFTLLIFLSNLWLFVWRSLLSAHAASLQEVYSYNLASTARKNRRSPTLRPRMNN